MNKGLLILNIILVIAVAVLFYLTLGKKESTGPSRNTPSIDTTSLWKHTPVAYFDMDSIEAKFVKFKQMQDEVVKRESEINSTINNMKQGFQSYYMKLQSQGENLSERQRDSLGNVLAKMDMDIKNKTAELNQEYQTYYMTKQQEIIRLIKDYCIEFNKEKKFSYIIAREPGLFYYTDTAYNVTSELLKGLNDYYNKKKS